MNCGPAAPTRPKVLEVYVIMHEQMRSIHGSGDYGDGPFFSTRELAEEYRRSFGKGFKIVRLREMRS